MMDGSETLLFYARHVLVPNLQVAEPPPCHVVAIRMLEVLKQLVTIVAHLVTLVVTTVVRHDRVWKLDACRHFAPFVWVRPVVGVKHGARCYGLRHA